MTVKLHRSTMSESNIGASCYVQYMQVDGGGGAVVGYDEWWSDTPVTFLYSYFLKLNKLYNKSINLIDNKIISINYLVKINQLIKNSKKDKFRSFYY